MTFDQSEEIWLNFGQAEPVQLVFGQPEPVQLVFGQPEPVQLNSIQLSLNLIDLITLNEFEVNFLLEIV